jgi:hypothetical protein
MRKHFGLNLILLIINITLLFGIIFVWSVSDNSLQITENSEVIEKNLVISNKQLVISEASEVIGDKIDEEDSNITIEQYNNEVATSSEIKIEEVPEPVPSKINLNVPFTSQAPEKNWEQPWQDACEEAAVLMLDAYYKGYSLSPLFSKDEILKMVEWEDERGWGTSISSDRVKELGEWFLFTTHDPHNTTQTVAIVEDPTVEEIKRFVASGDPVLVLAYGKDLPNPHFTNDGPEYHALIIRGYNESEFITNDPGTQFGENFKYKYDDLMNAIHDWNGGNVAEGGSVVLVVQ